MKNSLFFICKKRHKKDVCKIVVRSKCLYEFRSENRKAKTCTYAHMPRNDKKVTRNKRRPEPKQIYTISRLGKNYKTVFKSSF